MRSLFKWSFLLAAPGALWVAFEMYGLTLRGPQMLFFSISHALLPIFLLVLIAVPLFAVWTLLTAGALFSASARQNLGLSLMSVTILLIAQLVNALSLVTYQLWSSGWMKVSICLVGWVAVAVWSTLALRWLFGAQQALPAAWPRSGHAAEARR